jgi:hypothetical protein
MSTQKQARLLSQKPEIIVATPGRFWELLEEVISCQRQFAFSHSNRVEKRSHRRYVQSSIRSHR